MERPTRCVFLSSRTQRAEQSESSRLLSRTYFGPRARIVLLFRAARSPSVCHQPHLALAMFQSGRGAPTGFHRWCISIEESPPTARHVSRARCNARTRGPGSKRGSGLRPRRRPDDRYARSLIPSRFRNHSMRRSPRKNPRSSLSDDGRATDLRVQGGLA